MASPPAVKIGPCGGSGGNEQDMNMTGVNRVIMIVINHSSTIDNMSVLFERNGLEEWTNQWGGGGGTLRSEVRLGSAEYITSVKGYISVLGTTTVVRSLTFVSNLRTFGPYGKEEGAMFQLPAISGKILGFHGRSGSLLDAFGIYVKTG